MKTTRHSLFLSIFIGIVTINIAVATMFAGLHDSKATSHYNKSLINLSNENTAYLEYIQEGLTISEINEVKYEIDIFGNLFEENLTLAEFSNNAQDKYLLIVTLLSIVLFLSSTSLCLENKTSKKLFTYFSLILYFITLIFMLTLPLPF